MASARLTALLYRVQDVKPGPVAERLPLLPLLELRFGAMAHISHIEAPDRDLRSREHSSSYCARLPPKDIRTPRSNVATRGPELQLLDANRVF